MKLSLESLWSDLTSHMVETYDLVEKPYDIPSLPKAQCIVVPMIREVIAPLVVRNNSADEITDQFVAQENRIRMIASKTKGMERRRGAQILRSLGLGGKAAANKAFIKKESTPGTVFDLNTFVFGDSAKGSGNFIYPVHSAVLYSDAVSVQPKAGQLESVFRQGGIYEDGGNFDPERRGSSNNIFTTYSVKPGTLFVQTAVFLGNRMTRGSFDHWLLSLGLAGAYGGTTATTGTNLTTHVAGVYWGSMERPINAPGEILKNLPSVEDVDSILLKLESMFGSDYPNHVGAEVLRQYLNQRVDQLEQRNAALLTQYDEENRKAKNMFDKWFVMSKGARG